MFFIIFKMFDFHSQLFLLWLLLLLLQTSQNVFTVNSTVYHQSCVILVFSWLPVGFPPPELTHSLTPALWPERNAPSSGTFPLRLTRLAAAKSNYWIKQHSVNVLDEWSWINCIWQSYTGRAHQLMIIYATMDCFVKKYLHFHKHSTVWEETSFIFFQLTFTKLIKKNPFIPSFFTIAVALSLTLM